MTTSVWGVDHGAEVSKAFKPILGGKPNQQVANGLKMVQSMPKPVKPPTPPQANQGFGSRLAARKKFGSGNESALGGRIKKNFEPVSKKAYEDRKSWNRPEVFNSRKQNTRNGGIGGALLGGATGGAAGLDIAQSGRGAAIGAGVGVASGAALGALSGHHSAHKDSNGAPGVRRAYNDTYKNQSQYKADKRVMGRKPAKAKLKSAQIKNRQQLFRDLSRVDD